MLPFDKLRHISLASITGPVSVALVHVFRVTLVYLTRARAVRAC